MENGEKILDIKNLSVVYRRRPSGSIFALSDVSFSVGRGETVGVAGESGCGKSTLCKAVLKLFRPWEIHSVEGEIFFRGKDVLKMPEEELRNVRGGKIAMVFQHPYASFNPVMKMGPQIGEVMELHNCRQDIGALLSSCGLGKRILDMYPHNLSGGMLQRAQLAVALSSGAEILIADEPTTSLDAGLQFEILKLLKALVKEKKLTLIFVSHNLRLIKFLTDRTLVFYGGFLVEDGPSADVFKNPLHPYTRYLLDCVPGLGSFKGAIPGAPPSLDKKISGCPFLGRCPDASDDCREPVPLKRQYHRVRCLN